MAASAVLKRGRAGPILKGYPWVFEGWIDRFEGEFADGDTLDLLDWRGAFVARAAINQSSKIRLRVFSRQREASFDEDLIEERLERAVHLREKVMALPREATAYRLVHSDGDGLSGLILDRYGDFLVMQVSSLIIERRRGALIRFLQERLSPRGIMERQDARSREREGLPPSEGVVAGSPPPLPLEIQEGGVKFLVDIAHGQKTGFFLDQRGNRQAASRYASGRRVLDAFSYTGGFGITAIVRGGAASVVGFDSSSGAVDLARKNAELNGVSIKMEKGDAFRELRGMVEGGEMFDLAVLDPPKFSPSRKDKSRALRGYREVNLQVLKMLSPGGILVTCSCSASMADYALEGIVAAAARDAAREIQVLERRGQGPDHPVAPGFPEGRYLTCLILSVH